jgi:hypothetical protein
MIIEIRELASNRNKKSPLGDLGEKNGADLAQDPTPKESQEQIILE